MGSHSYLQNMETNIHDLHTSGLLNSHANRFTTTNVGHMAGDRSSVINLGLEELTLIDKARDYLNDKNIRLHKVKEAPECGPAK